MTRTELKKRISDIDDMTGITQDVRHALIMNAYNACSLHRLRRKVQSAQAHSPEAVVWANRELQLKEQQIRQRGSWHYIPMPANTPREEYKHYCSYWLN